MSKLGRLNASSRSDRRCLRRIVRRTSPERRSCRLAHEPVASVPVLANTVPSPANAMSPWAPNGASSAESSRGKRRPVHPTMASRGITTDRSDLISTVTSAPFEARTAARGRAAGRARPLRLRTRLGGHFRRRGSFRTRPAPLRAKRGTRRPSARRRGARHAGAAQGQASRPGQRVDGQAPPSGSSRVRLRAFASSGVREALGFGAHDVHTLGRVAKLAATRTEEKTAGVLDDRVRGKAEQAFAR